MNTQTATSPIIQSLERGPASRLETYARHRVGSDADPFTAAGLDFLLAVRAATITAVTDAAESGDHHTVEHAAVHVLHDLRGLVADPLLASGQLAADEAVWAAFDGVRASQCMGAPTDRTMTDQARETLARIASTTAGRLISVALPEAAYASASAWLGDDAAAAAYAAATDH